MAREFMDTLPDPAVVGESLYRAIHEELVNWLETMPDHDPLEVASDLARDLRETATLIENKVKRYQAEHYEENN
jgi:hypothetical protein